MQISNYDNSINIMNNIILSCVLEPIPEKDGCTTRTKDWQEKSKLEYFLISGVRIGPAFYELIERIKANKYKQPNLIYDIAYRAQLSALNNRNGGKINFGIIELLVPIVTAQIVYKKYDITVLDYVEIILKNTSSEDVKFHQKFRELARSVSKYAPGTETYDLNNMYDYYLVDKDDFVNNIHKEYYLGFTRVKKAYAAIEKNVVNYNLLDSSVIAYNEILNDCNNYYGLAADYICIAIYLYLCKYSDAIII